MSSPHHGMTSKQPPKLGLRQFAEVFQYSLRAFQLVWTTSRFLTVMLVVLTLAAGLMPAAIAYLGKLIVDAVVLAASYEIAAPGTQFDWLPFADDSRMRALLFVAAEGLLVALAAGVQRGIMICQSLLRALLGQRVNVMILEKALTLTLPHFEDSEFYDKLTRARREASSRPLSLVNRTFGLIQNLISLVAFGGLLFQFSGIAVAILALAGLPAFFAEARYSGEAFRLFRWRSPEARQQMYLETILAREDHAKEVKLFQIGRRLLDRYQAIFQKLYPEDRSLTLRRGFWGYLLGLVATGAFYFVYGWIVLAAISRSISLGEMTLYLIVFRQGQSAVAAILTAVGGMYEDNLYLSNLYEFLEQEMPGHSGTALQGSLPGDGVRFENVVFTYPGATEPAINGVSFHLKPGCKLALVGQNGSGKTTLIKLLAGLYQPDSGRILIDGTAVGDWDMKALHRRIAVIFQDFGRYQLTVGENVGAGDDVHFENEARWDEAAAKGMAKPFIDEMPETYKTQLGTWFKGGRELSGGQWQKVALSRLFIREDADILVLDEPTAAMDAESEFKIFEHFRQTTQGQMAILISHRFSTVRMADEIAVLEGGRITEFGSHDELMTADGQYAKLFRLQAKGYQ